MAYLSSIIFIVVAGAAVGMFLKNITKIRKNIFLGRAVERNDNRKERIRTMLLVAFGQQKMFSRPIPALMHLFIYVAFVITQIELIEIFVDGISGQHRIFMPALGGFYTFMISLIEVLSALALLATFVFLARRNLLKIPRFHMSEMTGWPKLDGNLILYMEFALVVFIFMMNGADEALYNMGQSHAEGQGSFGFALSSIIGPNVFGGMEVGTLHVIERIGWWGHITIVFTFLNYLIISKHLHIILAFPNVFYSNLKSKGFFNNMEAVKKEVELMFDPSADPYAAPAPAEGEPAEPQRFGAKDVTDLSWINLMNAYTCTECGRCSSVCPASQTGKALSPRKIMMDTRDRTEEVGKNRAQHGEDHDDGKSLFDYISEEELRACTSCNACTDACPVNIDPLAIIVDLRRYLIMEESKSPEEWTVMFNNIENNGAPWAFSQADRFKWAEEE